MGSGGTTARYFRHFSGISINTHSRSCHAICSRCISSTVGVISVMIRYFCLPEKNQGMGLLFTSSDGAFTLLKRNDRPTTGALSPPACSPIHCRPPSSTAINERQFVLFTVNTIRLTSMVTERYLTSKCELTNIQEHWADSKTIFHSHLSQTSNGSRH